MVEQKRDGILRSFSDESGSAVFTILIAFAVLTAVGLSVMNSWSSGTQQIATLNQRVAAVSLKANMEAYFKDPVAWTKMKQLAAANNTTCLTAGGPCPSSSPQPIKAVFNASDKLVFLGSGVTGININSLLNANGIGQGIGNGGGGGGNSNIDPTGLSFSGETCKPSAVSDPTCPFRVDATWEPTLCSSGSLATNDCVPSQIKIVGKIVLKDSSAIQQKSDNYSFTVLRAP